MAATLSAVIYKIAAASVGETAIKSNAEWSWVSIEIDIETKLILNNPPKIRVKRFHNSWVGSRASVRGGVKQLVRYYNRHRLHQSLD